MSNSSSVKPQTLTTNDWRLKEPPTYEELKRDDGARLFARLLYSGMQE